MNYAVPIIAFITGLMFGGVALWLLIRTRVAGAIAETQAELQPQLGALKERLDARDARIVQLDGELQRSDGQITSLQTETTELKNVRSELQTLLLKEREAALEKLAMLEEAKTNLKDAFNSLASDALKG